MHDFEKVGNVLSGSHSLKALICFQKLFPLACKGIFIAVFRTLSIHLPSTQLSPLGHPGFYQGALITLTWNEPSGSAGHQVLPELLVRAPHEAGQWGPPEAGRQRERLVPWAQGLDVSPIECLHKEGWEELPGQILQSRKGQSVIPQQVLSCQIQDSGWVPDVRPDYTRKGVLWKLPRNKASMSGQEEHT